MIHPEYPPRVVGDTGEIKERDLMKILEWTEHNQAELMELWMERKTFRSAKWCKVPKHV